MTRSNADIIRSAWNDIILHLDSNNDRLEQELKKNWVRLGNEISFAGVSKIYNYFKGKLSRKRIEEILTEIPTYSRYKEKRKSNFHNPIFIYYKHQIWSLDLMYVHKWKGYNDRVQYFLTVLESFSRKLFLVPMRNKTTKTTLSSFRSVHRHIGKTPHMLYVDKGGEFQSETFQEYCDLYKIKIVFSESPYKSSLVERAQRSLQNIMFRNMNFKNTRRHIEDLPKIVHTFNSRVNRTIGMSPNDAFLPKTNILCYTTLSNTTKNL